MFGARAARAALAEPRRRRAPGAGRRAAQRRAAAAARAESREALWRYAGLERDGDGPARADARPASAGAPDRRLRAGPRGEPRRPPAHATSPSSIPARRPSRDDARRGATRRSRPGAETDVNAPSTPDRTRRSATTRSVNDELNKTATCNFTQRGVATPALDRMRALAGEPKGVVVHVQVQPSDLPRAR